MRVIERAENRPPLQITLTPTLSRSTGRGGLSGPLSFRERVYLEGDLERKTFSGSPNHPHPNPLPEGEGTRGEASHSHPIDEGSADPSHVLALNPAHHLPTLDGLRGLAILGVMFTHMSILADVPDPNRPWIDSAWLWIATFGGIGVDLFFVLSGFLITGILLAAKGQRGYFGHFYARRVLRIFPLYYAIVCISLLLIPHVHNMKSMKFAAIHGDEWGYWTLMSNWVIGYRHAFRHGILDVTWSLGIEEQFYLLWPAVVLLLSGRKLLWTCGLLFLGAIATRTFMYVGLHAPEIRVMTWTPCRMDALVAGAAVAIISRSARGLLPLRSLAGWVAAATAVLLLAYRYWQGPSWDGGTLGQTLGYSALALCFAAVTLLAATAEPTTLTARFLSWPPLRNLGRYSYALYLFHFPIRAVIRDTFYGPSKFLTLGPSQLPGQFLFYALCMSISYVFAWLSWHLFERHFLKLKRFVPMPRSRHETGTRLGEASQFRRSVRTEVVKE